MSDETDYDRGYRSGWNAAIAWAEEAFANGYRAELDCDTPQDADFISESPTNSREARVSNVEVESALVVGDDNLERIHCPKAGQVFHAACGWCATHDGPMYECICGGPRKAPPIAPPTEPADD